MKRFVLVGEQLCRTFNSTAVEVNSSMKTVRDLDKERELTDFKRKLVEVSTIFLSSTLWVPWVITEKLSVDGEKFKPCSRYQNAVSFLSLPYISLIFPPNSPPSNIWDFLRQRLRKRLVQ